MPHTREELQAEWRDVENDAPALGMVVFVDTEHGARLMYRAVVGTGKPEMIDTTTNFVWHGAERWKPCNHHGPGRAGNQGDATVTSPRRIKLRRVKRNPGTPH